MKAGLIAGAVALSLIGAGACRDSGVVTASYFTLDEARAAGAFANGDIPEGLPPGTRDIREAHDRDRARRWLLFSFPPAERGALMALLEPQTISLAGQSADVPGRLEWWPLLLRDQLDAERIAETGLMTYRTRSGDAFVAVNWSQGRAYLWKAGK